MVGVDTDRLFPLDQQEQIARLAPGAGAVWVIRSLHGHDGFLVEADQLAAIVAEALGELGEGRTPSATQPAA